MSLVFLMGCKKDKSEFPSDISQRLEGEWFAYDTYHELHHMTFSLDHKVTIDEISYEWEFVSADETYEHIKVSIDEDPGSYIEFELMPEGIYAGCCMKNSVAICSQWWLREDDVFIVTINEDNFYDYFEETTIMHQYDATLGGQPVYLFLQCYKLKEDNECFNCNVSADVAITTNAYHVDYDLDNLTFSLTDLIEGNERHIEERRYVYCEYTDSTFSEVEYYYLQLGAGALMYQDGEEYAYVEWADSYSIENMQGMIIYIK